MQYNSVQYPSKNNLNLNNYNTENNQNNTYKERFTQLRGLLQNINNKQDEIQKRLKNLSTYVENKQQTSNVNIFPKQNQWLNPDYDFSSDTIESTIDKNNLSVKNTIPKFQEQSLYERNKKDILNNNFQNQNNSFYNTRKKNMYIENQYQSQTPKAMTNKSFDLSFLSQNKSTIKKKQFIFDELNSSIMKNQDSTPKKQRIYFNPQSRPFSQIWMKSYSSNQISSCQQNNLENQPILEQNQYFQEIQQNESNALENYQASKPQSNLKCKNRIFSDNQNDNSIKLSNLRFQTDTIKINDTLSKTVKINQFLEKDELGYKQIKIYDESFSKILPLYSQIQQQPQNNFNISPINKIMDDFENEMINQKNKFNTSPYNKLKQSSNYKILQQQQQQQLFQELIIDSSYIDNRYRHLISLAQNNIYFVEQYFLHSIYQSSGHLILYENDEIRIEIYQELVKTGQFKINYNLKYINKLIPEVKANQLSMFTIFLINTQLQRQINIDQVILNKTLLANEQENQNIQINAENFDFQYVQELIIECSYRMYHSKQINFFFMIPSPIMIMLNQQTIDPEQFEAKWQLLKLGVGAQKFVKTSFAYDCNYIKRIQDIQRIFNKCVPLSTKSKKKQKQKFGTLCFYKGKNEFLLKIILLLDKPFLILKISFQHFQEKQGFKKFVQVGRAVYVNEGQQEGKVGVIVNILSQTKVQVDGEDFKRQVIPINRLRLTGLFLKDVLLGQRTGLLRKKIAKFELSKKFAATNLSKQLTRQRTRANLSDFDRFKVMVLKKRLNYSVGVALKKGTTTKATKQAPKKK